MDTARAGVQLRVGSVTLSGPLAGGKEEGKEETGVLPASLPGWSTSDVKMAEQGHFRVLPSPWLAMGFVLGLARNGVGQL